jgi:carbamoyl-phosphate synthase large subunit
MNILITSAGQRVSLVRAFKTELCKLFPKAKVFTVDMNPTLSAACNVSDGYKTVQPIAHPDYIKNLISICKDLDVSLIIPTIDTELLLLSRNKNLFSENQINVIISEDYFITTCRDKRLTYSFFKDAGISIPKQIDKNKPEFPLFIKPYDGSLSKDIYVVHTLEELKPDYYSNEKLMFMEYISPLNFDEYTIDAYYDINNSVKCAVPRKRIAVRSGEISKGLTCKNFLVDFIKDKLFKIDGAIGCLTIQMFYNSRTQQVIGIEINPRFGGGYPLTYLSGANYPLWLIREYMLKEKIEFYNDWENNLLMLRYDDEILVHNFNE